MIALGSIRCPICRIDLRGDRENDLTAELREHFSTIHEIGRLTWTTEDGKSRGHQLQLWEGMKRGTVVAEQEVGEDVEETVRCPFCGERVYGHDGNELSNNLVVHIEDVHDLRPFRPLLTLPELIRAS